MPKTTTSYLRSAPRAEPSGTLPNGSVATGPTAEKNRDARGSSSFGLSSVFQRFAIGRRAARQGAPALRSSPERVARVTDLPDEVLRKIGNDLRGCRDMTNFALATSSVQAALLPETAADKFPFLEQTAASASDPESFALALRTARALPDPMHAKLLEAHAACLPRIATGNGTFAAMKSGAKDAAARFRVLAEQLAALSPEFRCSPAAALAPHLGVLPIQERAEAMEMLLEMTSQQVSPRKRSKVLIDFALGMHHFGFTNLPDVALRILREAEPLPPSERRALADAFRTALGCRMPEAARFAIETALARFEKA